MDLLVLLLLLAGVVWLGSYIVSAWWWPYTACGRCRGAGRFKRDDGRVWRTCRKCRGAGSRLRWGRRAYNRWHR